MAALQAGARGAAVRARAARAARRTCASPKETSASHCRTEPWCLAHRDLSARRVGLVGARGQAPAIMHSFDRQHQRSAPSALVAARLPSGVANGSARRYAIRSQRPASMRASCQRVIRRARARVLRGTSSASRGGAGGREEEAVLGALGDNSSRSCKALVAARHACPCSMLTQEHPLGCAGVQHAASHAQNLLMRAPPTGKAGTAVTM